MARILLGVSGGIAAYKALEFARLATLAGHGGRVLMTESAGRFVGAASFAGVVAGTGRPLGRPRLLGGVRRPPGPPVGVAAPSAGGRLPGQPAPGARPD